MTATEFTCWMFVATVLLVGVFVLVSDDDDDDQDGGAPEEKSSVESSRATPPPNGRFVGGGVGEGVAGSLLLSLQNRGVRGGGIGSVVCVEVSR